jgi:CheY-like chemotaxis protein
VALSLGADRGDYAGEAFHHGKHARPSNRGLRQILVVDDAAESREVFALYFMNQGFDVETVDDGVGAIEAARRLQPDVIVMDVAMPGLDGISAARELKLDPRTANIPVVLLTAYPIHAIRDGALEVGAHFVMKPCLPEDLEEHVRNLLHRRSSGDACGGERNV